MTKNHFVLQDIIHKAHRGRAWFVNRLLFLIRCMLVCYFPLVGTCQPVSLFPSTSLLPLKKELSPQIQQAPRVPRMSGKNVAQHVQLLVLITVVFQSSDLAPHSPLCWEFAGFSSVVLVYFILGTSLFRGHNRQGHPVTSFWLSQLWDWSSSQWSTMSSEGRDPVLSYPLLCLMARLWSFINQCSHRVGLQNMGVKIDV